MPDKIGWGKFQPYVRYQHAIGQCSGTAGVLLRYTAANLGTRSVTEEGLTILLTAITQK